MLIPYSVPLDIPLNPMFSPVLTVYFYDDVLGFIGSRLIGICHIPLKRYVKSSLQRLLEKKINGELDDIFGFNFNFGTSFISHSNILESDTASTKSAVKRSKIVDQL